MKNVTIECASGEERKVLAYIEKIGGLSYNKCYLIEVKGLEKV